MSNEKDVMKELEDFLKLIGISSREEALAQSIKDMTDVEKIEFFTYLFQYEDENMAELLSISDDYTIEWLKAQLIYFLKLRCSVSGWRSNQFVDMIREKEKAKRSIMDRILRREKEKGMYEPKE